MVGLAEEKYQISDGCLQKNLKVVLIARSLLEGRIFACCGPHHPQGNWTHLRGMAAFTSLVVVSAPCAVTWAFASTYRMWLPVLSSQLCMDVFSFLPLPSARVATRTVSETNIPSLVCCWWGTVAQCYGLEPGTTINT